MVTSLVFIFVVVNFLAVWNLAGQQCSHGACYSPVILLFHSLVKFPLINLLIVVRVNGQVNFGRSSDQNWVVAVWFDSIVVRNKIYFVHAIALLQSFSNVISLILDV